MEIVNIKGKDYQIIRLLGHGKGGYSYLVEYEGRKAVLKQIHHEPCDYYQFGNKIEAEINDYRRLKEAGIRIPEMLDLDIEKECIVKEYVEGDTIFDLVRNDIPIQRYIEQVREMAKTAKEAGLNIDYFPTNFVVHDETIWYIDYECNGYCEEWNFENWGIRYWSRSKEFEEYLNSLNQTANINHSAE